MSDLIERIPEGFTPGPWKWWTSNSWRRLKRDDWGISQSVAEPYVCRDGHPDLTISQEDMALIALAPELAAGYRAQAARIAELEAEVARLRADRDVSDFDSADWYWRTMDPDDCGDYPEEAINRAMVGRFCVCEIGCSFTGPIRYGFIAPTLDPDSDDERFVHFATQAEAIEAAKDLSAALAAPDTGGAE